MQKKRYLKRQDAHFNTNKASLTSLTFEQAFEQYVDFKKSCNVRPRTLDTYNDSIKLFMKWIKENKEEIDFVYDLKVKDVREYLNYLQYEHLNFKTKENCFS